MTPVEFRRSQRTANTAFGGISYVERGSGPAALFVHGVPLNGFHWRHALTALADVRRCLAPDLMGLGYTEVAPDQNVSFDRQAEMLLAFLDALGVDEIDLVGNDSGGAIAQILATRAPERIRSLTLTNCDAHDNWPPEAFMPAVERARKGEFSAGLELIRQNPAIARSGAGLGVAFQFPERLSDEIVEVYLAPLVASDDRRALIDRYVASMDCAQTLRIYDPLRGLQSPTLIIWGDSDVFFPEHWAHWLAETIPGTRKTTVLQGAKLFFPEERSEELIRLLREHWRAAESTSR